MNMGVEICGVKLKNPIIAASGTFAFGREYARFFDISLLGGIAVKGLTLEPRFGNPPPRIAETPSGVLNAVGLQNPGVNAFLREELSWLREKNLAVIVNIAGNTAEDYCEMARRVSVDGVDIVELNISCPNVKQGGVAFGNSPQGVAAITGAVRAACKKPLMVKLSPNVQSIADCARAAEGAGADALSLINTLTGMAIDVNTRRPVLGNVTGGLSGPAIRPVALRMAFEAARAVSIPVVGSGGIQNGEDAAAFLLAGCRAVQIGTANLSDPYACTKAVFGLEAYLKRQKLEDVNDLVGGLILPQA